MVKPVNVLGKIGEVLAGKGTHAKNNSLYLEKYVEGLSDVRDYSVWRISDLNTNEELYIDVYEYYDCIVEKYSLFFFIY